LHPKEINIIAVHAVFSPPAVERLSELTAHGLVRHIMITDTVYCPECVQEEIPNLEIVPSTNFSAQIIGNIALDQSISKLLEPFNAETYLKRPRLF
jgi:ribose-phosphate pyrophosphokinase